MPTKLILKYSIVSGPFGNTRIQTKIDGKPEKLPFESMYLKENPLEVLKNIARKYNVSEYKSIERNCLANFDFKKHFLLYGFSIKEANLEGVTINNEIKEVNLSFLPKLDLRIAKPEEEVENLIRKYIVTTHTKYGPTFIVRGRGLESNDTKVTENYFQEREKEKIELKERQLSHILEYAKIILDKQDFSIKNLEEMVS